MKKLKLFIPAIILIMAATACHRGPHVIIATQNNDVSTKIEYTGTIVLNADRSRIEHISPGGYINYNNNGNQLYAAPEPNGHITYEINGDKTETLNANGRSLLAQAIKIIAKAEHSNN